MVNFYIANTVSELNDRIVLNKTSIGHLPKSKRHGVEAVLHFTQKCYNTINQFRYTSNLTKNVNFLLVNHVTYKTIL